MSSETRQTEENKTARRVNPATASLPLLLKALGTDPAQGLPHREARKRAQKNSGSLFSDGTLTPRQCVRRVCAEPMLWLFLTIGIAAAFFGRAAIGLTCAAVTVLYAAVYVLMLYRTEQTDARMAQYDKPLCRVLRGGRIRRIGADGVVRGDVIILLAGDVVPADARLLSVSPDFTVTERELEAQEKLRHTVRLAKDPEAHADPNAPFLHSPDNMVFAGGIVEQGSARAVTVAVGAHTHLAGLSGSVRPSHKRRDKDTVRAASAVLRRCSLLCVAAVIPMIVVGILTLRSRYDLLDIVLTATALTVLTLRTPMLIREEWVSARIRAGAASGRDADNTADVRTTVVLDKLNAIDELMLVGTAGLHDGKSHPDQIAVGGVIYDCTKYSDGTVPARFIEGMWCIRTALSQCAEPLDMTDTLHAEEGTGLINELLAWAQPDEEGYRLRLESADVFRSDAAGRTMTNVTVRMSGGRPVTYRLSEMPSDAAACPLMPDGTGEVPMSMTLLNAQLTQSRRAQLSGYRCLYLISVRDGEDCLEGTLIHTPYTCRKTAGIIRSLEESGIRVTAFLSGETEENARILSECGLTAQTAADRPADGADRTPAALLCETGVRAFEGCTPEYVKQYVEDRHSAGKRVCLMTGDASARPLMRLCDLTVTVSPSLYLPGDAREAAFAGACADLDGEADSCCANDLCRRQADLVVRRATANGGGVHGFRKALAAARHYRHLTHSLRRFTFCAQLMRVLTVLIPLCCGLELTSALLIILSGMAIDTAAAALAVTWRLPNEADLEKQERRCRSKTPQTADWSRFPRPFLRETFASAAACIVPWAIAGIAVLTGRQFGGTLEAYAMLCLLSGMAAACVTDPCLRGSTRYGFPLSLLMVCVYFAGLAAALGSGLALWWTLVIPLSAFAAFAVVTVLSGKRERRTGGKSGKQ